MKNRFVKALLVIFGLMLITAPLRLFRASGSRDFSVELALILSFVAVICGVLVLRKAFTVGRRTNVGLGLAEPIASASSVSPQRDTVTSSSSGEEAAFAAALHELDSGDRVDGLWAKSLAFADGDIDKAKAAYLRDRAKQLLFPATHQESLGGQVEQLNTEELELVERMLSEKGYRVVRKKNGWVVTEPLGGRWKTSDFDELKQYAESRDYS